VPYYLNVSEESSDRAKKTLAEFDIKPSNFIVGIAPGGGASWGKDAIYKQWPAERFGQLSGRLINELNAKVVLLGSTDEKSLAEIARNDSMSIIDLTGKLSLEELAAVIKELRLLVCNDGGLLHMATVLGTGTVSIFGPVDEKVYGPYPPGEKHMVMKKDMPCRPCYRNFRFSGCFNNKRCLEDITVDAVFEMVERLLNMY
jgi:ADP-heptose:LPS heptosyltransferase